MLHPIYLVRQKNSWVVSQFIWGALPPEPPKVLGGMTEQKQVAAKKRGPAADEGGGRGGLASAPVRLSLGELLLSRARRRFTERISV